ncbi:Csu type fimbrial protein [Brevundimonas lenta]|uniref:Spore coat protein U-like protein n=1 Tax=Brevundimonas lenta TaxID=424796 RepID=A0A7W6NR73_9CAUL|nr:spore coat U domain-containing protein [Brevundimonas lenta]MBB4083957.1 spore coat protein U-like protein [Brevundimonas lenta]
MRISLPVLILAGLAATTATAQTRTAQFAVRAQVVADCQITAQDLNFGTYSSTTAATASTPLNLRCTPGSSATISLDGGSSGNPQARTMQGQGASLGYQLYRDAALQNPINTAGMAWQLQGSQNTGQTVVYTIFGQVPANQLVPAGNYVDTIRVTVNY